MPIGYTPPGYVLPLAYFPNYYRRAGRRVPLRCGRRNWGFVRTLPPLVITPLVPEG